MAAPTRPPLQGWLSTPTAVGPAARPLAHSLPVSGAPAATTWLAAPPPSAADAGPPPCPRCGDLDRLQAELADERMTAAAQGRDDGLAETATLRARLATAVAALANVHSEREAALTETIVDVALGLCEWLAPAAAAIDRRGLSQLVSQALAAGGGRDLVLRLNGDDAAELGNQIPSGVTCEVVADLAPGEIWVEAPRLVVDARWPTRLAALREPLLALLKQAAPTYDLATDDDRPVGGMSQRMSVQRGGDGGGTGVSQRIAVPRDGTGVSQRIAVPRDGGRSRSPNRSGS